MAKGRDNVAENLSDVLELIRIRQQSGQMSVECSQGGRIEEGEIYFLQGQPTYAQTGQLFGWQALSEILSWQQVYFSFITNALPPSPNVSSARGSINNAASRAYIAPAQSLQPSIPPKVNSNRWPDRPRENEYVSVGSPVRSALAQAEGRLVPQRMGGNREVLSLPISRRQRLIYLLVDGRRTVSDLCRCTGKSVQEVELILGELKEQGLLFL